MILPELKLQLPVSKLTAIAPGAEIHKPRKKDYWAEQWQTMKHYTGANIREKVAGKELFYQLGFMHGKMVSVQINTTADFTEAGYAALIAIGEDVVKANAQRVLETEGAVSAAIPWSELKDQRLAESGLPNDRYYICRSVSWRAGKVHSYLSIALEWPHVLSLEYREETRDAV